MQNLEIIIICSNKPRSYAFCKMVVLSKNEVWTPCICILQGREQKETFWLTGKKADMFESGDSIVFSEVLTAHIESMHD